MLVTETSDSWWSELLQYFDLSDAQSDKAAKLRKVQVADNLQHSSFLCECFCLDSKSPWMTTPKLGSSQTCYPPPPIDADGAILGPETRSRETLPSYRTGTFHVLLTFHYWLDLPPNNMLSSEVIEEEKRPVTLLSSERNVFQLILEFKPGWATRSSLVAMSCPANQMISNCHLGLCRSIIQPRYQRNIV